MVTKHPNLPAQDEEQERLIGIVFKVSPRQAALISCLLRGSVVTTQQLIEYIGGKTHPRIDVAAARTRLKEEGLEIQSHTNSGYWMEAETKEEIEKRLEEFLRSM